MPFTDARHGAVRESSSRRAKGHGSSRSFSIARSPRRQRNRARPAGGRRHRQCGEWRSQADSPRTHQVRVRAFCLERRRDVVGDGHLEPGPILTVVSRVGDSQHDCSWGGRPRPRAGPQTGPTIAPHRSPAPSGGRRGGTGRGPGGPPHRVKTFDELPTHDTCVSVRFRVKNQARLT